MIISSYNSLPEAEKKKLKELEEKISATRLDPKELAQLAQKEAESRSFCQGVRVAERRKQAFYYNQLIGERQK